jgi:drug/metabolite transporter (DMT)-like permease
VDGLTAAYQRILGGLIVGALPAIWLLGRQIVESRDRTAGCPPGSSPVRRLPWRKASPWVLLNALAGPALGVGCYQWALATTPSGIVLPIVATLPIAVIPLAYLFEGDRPSWRSVLGGVVAVAGVIALTMARR